MEKNKIDQDKIFLLNPLSLIFMENGIKKIIY